MPPSTLVPMAFCAPAPAPVVVASGSTPKPKASDVIMMGRKRSFAPSRVASKSPMPFSRPPLANWTIRMAFFVVSPSVVSSPIWKYTSLARPRKLDAMIPPMTPSGKTSRMAMGIAQLS